MFRFVTAVGILACLTGCNATSPEPEPEGEIAVSISKMVSEVTPSFAVRVVVGYTIENLADTPVYYRTCLTFIDRLVEEHWQSRWGRSCLTFEDPVVSIEAHSVKLDSMVVEYNHSPFNPENYKGPIAGTYSVRVSVEDPRGVPLTSVQTRSPSFTLSEPR